MSVNSWGDCNDGCRSLPDTLNILTEYAEGGKLLSHLHQQRGRGMLWRTKVDYGLQVARGMEYLAHMQVGRRAVSGWEKSHVIVM